MKKIMAVLVLVFIAVCATCSHAEDRDNKIMHLIEVRGVLQTFRQSVEANKIGNLKLLNQIGDRFMSEANSSEDFKKRAGVARANYIEKVMALFSPEDMVASWKQKYSAHFTDEELDQQIAYYSSDIGKKDVMFARNSMEEVSAAIREKAQPTIVKAIQEYAEAMKQASEEFHKAARTKKLEH